VDNLTHTAVGLFLSRAGLGRKVPHSTLILLLAANAPDIDVVSAAGGGISYINFHRHLTHALPLLPLMALLPVVLARLFSRGPFPWRRAWLIALAGVASHLALDLTNVYGVRLFAPFTFRWFEGDLFSVVDLWIWGVCLLAIVGTFVQRLVGAEIGGAARRTAPGRGFAIFALVFLALYGGAREILPLGALAVLAARLYEGEAPLRVAAFPQPANPFEWRGLVETGEFFGEHTVNLIGEFDPGAGHKYYKPAMDAAMAAARRTKIFQDYMGFTQYPLWRVTPVLEPQAGTRVELMDLRFGTPDRPGFVATAIIDEAGRPVRSWFSFGAARPR
jgi:inner membrane protein